MKRGDLAARLAARLNAQTCAAIGSSGDSSITGGAACFSRVASAPAGTKDEGRPGCATEVDSEPWQCPADSVAASGPLARLPFFRSFRAVDWVHMPAGVGLALVGSWTPPISSS